MAKVVLVEASPWLISDGSQAAVRLAGGGRAGRAYNQRGFTDWRSGIANLPRFAAAFGYGERGWTGGAVPQVAPIVFAPTDKALLAGLVDDYLWIGAPITVRTSDDELATPVYLMEMTGTVASCVSSDGSLTLVVTDLSGALDKPHVTSTFAGTGGIEGILEAEGRAKRRTYGFARHIEGFVLDKAANVYEFGDPSIPLSAFTNVADMGRVGPITALAWQGSALATLDALKVAVAPAGGCVAAPSIACVKWWTVPNGPLTADIQAAVGAGSNKAADVAAMIVSSAGGPAFDATSFAAVNAARTATSGLHFSDSGETTAAALDRLLLPLSVLWSVDSGGTIRLSEVKLTDPVETLAGLSFERVESYRPAKSVKVGYYRNHRRHSDGEVSAAVLASDLEGYIGWDQVAPGDGRPADNADVTADNSALGDGNRVRYSLLEAGTRGWKTLFNPLPLAVIAAALSSGGKRYYGTLVPFTANNQTFSAGTSNVEQIPVRGLERLSVQILLAIGANGNLLRTAAVVIQWTDAAGGSLGSTPLGNIGIASGSAFGTVAAFVVAPATAVSAFIEVYLYSNNGGAGNVDFWLGEPMVTSAGAAQTVHPTFVPGPSNDPAADVTKNIVGPTSKVIPYSHLGVASGLPLNLAYFLNSGAGKVTTGATWSYKVISGTVNGFTSASAEQAMTVDAGDAFLPLSSLGTNEAKVEVRATMPGVAPWLAQTILTKDTAPAPPAETGGGSMPVNFTVATGISSTSFETVASFSGTMPAGKTTATITAELYFDPYSPNKTATSTVEAKIERNISGVWTLVGSLGSAGVSVANFEPVGGGISLAGNSTGLTAGGTYDWRIVARLTSVASVASASASGTGSATAP